jgi:hypothetical protein
MEGCSFVNPTGLAVEEVLTSAWGASLEKVTETVSIESLDGWIGKKHIEREYLPFKREFG